MKIIINLATNIKITWFFVWTQCHINKHRLNNIVTAFEEANLKKKLFVDLGTIIVL